mmetsp:Transcript_1246/g.2704  ORF Transcript_1246/g.2704 Transcript_1246/m.2704 type:complete len:163 (-) Transcript_1246:681-1169(-)
MVSERVEKIAAALTPSVSTSGKKDILFNRLRDCGDKHITKIDEVTFEWKQEKAPEGTVPKWIILDGEPAEKRQGINMLSRAQEGYFGPTNKENVDGAVKCKYLTRPEERIEHPAFVRKKTTTATPAPPSEKGGPSPAAYKAIGNLCTSRPKDSLIRRSHQPL